LNFAFCMIMANIAQVTDAINVDVALNWKIKYKRNREFYLCQLILNPLNQLSKTWYT
jgi:hypothetical protein